MSKSTPKQRVTQLQEWLKTMKPATSTPAKKFSKANHYKQANNRYGKKSN